MVAPFGDGWSNHRCVRSIWSGLGIVEGVLGVNGVEPDNSPKVRVAKSRTKSRTHLKVV